MKSRRREYSPKLERIEERVLLSTIGTRIGRVTRPHDLSTTSVDISARNLTPTRHTTVIGVSARPTTGSGVHPKIVSTTGPDGTSLPLLRITPYGPRHRYPARSFTKVAQAGAIATTVTGKHATTGEYAATTELPGDMNSDGVVNLVDLDLFVPHYGSEIGKNGYTPAADFNHNGRIGQNDARFILRNMGPLSRKIPLQLDVRLAPGDEIRYDGTKVSGATTLKKNVTILGHTTPGSIVFQDGDFGNYSFGAKAIATDARGNFTLPVVNQKGFNNYIFLVLDPFNQQTVRVFSVFWVNGAYRAN